MNASSATTEAENIMTKHKKTSHSTISSSSNTAASRQHAGRASQIDNMAGGVMINAGKMHYVALLLLDDDEHDNHERVHAHEGSEDISTDGAGIQPSVAKLNSAGNVYPGPRS